MIHMADREVPRLVPEEPLPPYAFVPGLFPHPVSDPAGHSFGQESPVAPQVNPTRWQTCRPYLYGIDLFNRGYYWESHVAWESLWIACGRKGIVADFLKGLIKLAAAGVKALEGTLEGVKSHSGRAAQLWQGVATQQKFFMGFSILSLIGVAAGIFENGWPTEPPFLRPQSTFSEVSQPYPQIPAVS